MDASLGLTFTLTPEVADSLQRGKQQQQQQQRDLPNHDGSKVEVSSRNPQEQNNNDKEEFDEHAFGSDGDGNDKYDVSGGNDQDNWDEIIPLPRPIQFEGSDDDDSNNSNEQINDDDDDDDDDDGDDDDDVSLSPPPSLPLVIVRLEKLCGFIPSSVEEAEELRNQIKGALLKDNDDDGSVDEEEEKEQGNNNDGKEQLSRHFDTRTTELFHTGMAFHEDTLSIENEIIQQQEEKQMASSTIINSNKFAVVSYPEYICRDDGSNKVLNTSHQWKLLLRKHSIPVVQRLLSHLTKCNRSFIWKIDMNRELWHLSGVEEKERVRRQREDELNIWRTKERKNKLDRLYQIRETFEMRLNVATDKLSNLEDERDRSVVKELQRRREELGENEQAGGLASIDFSSTTFAFPDDHDDNDDDDKELQDGSSVHDNDLSDDDYDGYARSDEEGGDDDTSTASQEVTEATDATSINNDDTGSSNDKALPLVTSAARAKARRKAAARRRRNQMKSQADAAERAIQRQKLEKAHAEEEYVRQYCTTPEYHKTEAVVVSLEQRMKQVDDLLETLQEEEWRDEEENETGGTNAANTDRQENQIKETEMTLLDQILAMILGALNKASDSDLEEHYKFVKEEHQRIVKDWKDHFGRLPASFTPTRDDTRESNASTLEHSSRHAISEDQSWEHGETSSSSDRIKRSVTNYKTETMLSNTVGDMKDALGIVDNTDDDDWEKCDWDDILNPLTISTKDASTANAPKEKEVAKMVLRPGGKAM